MQNGFTPAHMASQNGHTASLALLLASKAAINAVNKVCHLKTKEVELFLIRFLTVS